MKQLNTSQDDVHIGQEGFLFLSGGKHNVFSYFNGERNPKPMSTEIFWRNVEARAAYCNRTGRRFRMTVFPEKCCAIQSLLGSEKPFTSLYERCYRKNVHSPDLLSNVLYPTIGLQNTPTAFFKTDTHYAAPGNLAVIRALLGSLFKSVLDEGVDRIERSIGEKKNYSGDLGRKFSPNITEDALVLKGGSARIKVADNGLQGGNDGICILQESFDALSDKTLLIFGDSFFRQMLPMLAVFYQRVIFCRTRFFQYEIVEAFRPDDIFCGIAERYLSACTSDEARPHFLSYPLVLGRPIAPDSNFPALWNDFVRQDALVK